MRVKRNEMIMDEILDVYEPDGRAVSPTPPETKTAEIIEEGAEELSAFWRGFDRLYRWLKDRLQPFVSGALAASAACFACGCSAMAPQTRTQSMGVYALGLPAIAVITQTSQATENTGDDTNSASQENPVEVKTEF